MNLNLLAKKKTDYIQQYFVETLKPGQKVWWINHTADADEAIPVKLTAFNQLDSVQQRRMILESFILFPEEILTSTYDSVTIHWLSKYNVYNPSLRDAYTAGDGNISL
ncbi:hypothetical protein AAHB49_16280 [Bacillus cereus]